MPRGTFPWAYVSSPIVGRPIERIYADYDAYTGEFFEDEPDLHGIVDFCVVLPPLYYQGIFVKGVFFSQATDLILDAHPALSSLFVAMAHSMFGSHPWSTRADGYLSLYGNPRREAWFRKTRPDRASVALIPLQDADFTNEALMTPRPVQERDIDVLCVSILHDYKNLPLVSRALRILRRKHRRRVRMTLIVGKPFDSRLNGLDPDEVDQLRKINQALGDINDYIDIIPYATYHEELPRCYSRSKVCVLGSLIEGKNRSLHEAMCCDTPVVCFSDYNRHIRGRSPIFPAGAGAAVDFDPEALADGLWRVLRHRGDYAPRAAYLAWNGRERFLNTCIEGLSCDAGALSLRKRGAPDRNRWLDLAVRENYGHGLMDFLYDRALPLSRAGGLDNIAALARYYLTRFGL